MLGDTAVRVEDKGNGKSNDKEGGDFGEEIVVVDAKESAVEEAPEEGGGESDFDVLPGGLVDGGEDADGLVVVGKFVDEMGECAEDRNGDNADQHE